MASLASVGRCPSGRKPFQVTRDRAIAASRSTRCHCPPSKAIYAGADLAGTSAATDVCNAKNHVKQSTERSRPRWRENAKSRDFPGPLYPSPNTARRIKKSDLRDVVSTHLCAFWVFAQAYMDSPLACKVFPVVFYSEEISRTTCTMRRPKEPRPEGLPRVRDPMETSRMQMTSKGAEHSRDGFRAIQQRRQAQCCPALGLRGLAIGPDMPPACLCRYEMQLEGTGTAYCNIATSGPGLFFGGTWERTLRTLAAAGEQMKS